MPLDTAQAQWLHRFTAGEVPLPPPAPNEAVPSARDQLAEQLRLAHAKERIEEQALKEVQIAKAIGVLDANKENMRQAFDLKAKTRKDGKKEKIQNVRDPKGRQQKAFDAAEAPDLTEVPEGYLEASQVFRLLVEQSDMLAAVKVERSRIDEKTGLIVKRAERLFTDLEIQEELYTPLVRELVLPETLVADKYSATQKMIDGSNEYYLNECRDKGKRMGTGGAQLSKDVIAVASSITTAVLGGLAPAADGKQAMAASGTLSKADAAKALAITQGVAALLTGTVEAVGRIEDFRNSGDFSVAGYKAVMNSVALGIGRIVAGSTGDMSIGLAVTDSITAATHLSAVVPQFVNWRKSGGEPPVAQIAEMIGGMIAAGFSTSSDLTSNDTSTWLARAGAIVGASFTALAKAQEKSLVASIRKGDWKSVFEVLSTAGLQAGQAVPTAVRFAEQYNAIVGDSETQFQQQLALVRATEIMSAEVDKLGASVESLSQAAGKALSERMTLEGKPMGEAQKQLEAINRAFAARQATLDEEALRAQAEELGTIQKQLDTERKAFQDSLLCLGSTEPSDAQYKSIAALIAQLERDRAIWNGVNAMFGAGLGIASSVASVSPVAMEVVPALKMAGQYLKFIANLKAAADRLSAFLDWKDARKDAQSAVSPYATSIENFCANQSEQFSHYTVQAAANIIQALLAAGEMTPYAPAFKVAGAAVAAAAATEQLVYTFHKQVALRKAWNDTKDALDPRNKGNRKMALLVRQINPTLAKYTIAYGALIEKSPVAITAMNRIGLDRESLTRAGDAVKDVKNYLEKLYSDDNVVLGVLDPQRAATKVPPPALTSRAWSLSHLLWTEKDGLVTANPPEIVANLALVEQALKHRADKSTPLNEAQLRALLEQLAKLETAFLSWKPLREGGSLHEAAGDAAQAYADLAAATNKAVRMELVVLVGNVPV